jgi:hypothetical protein
VYILPSYPLAKLLKSLVLFGTSSSVLSEVASISLMFTVGSAGNTTPA